jgi:hypothetical protein
MADEKEVVAPEVAKGVQRELEGMEVDQVVNEEVQEKQDAVTEEVSEDEIIALDSGWKPKDQWEGDPKKWVPAEEYNRRGELFSKIDSLGKDLRDTKKALRMLQEHHSKVKETEYSRALSELRAAKKQAMETGDADAVMSADDQIMDMKAARLAEEQNQRHQATQLDPRFVSWIEKNPWYGQDAEMKSFADDVGIAHAKSHPEKSPDEVLKYVELRIKRSYPERFTNPNRNRPSAVAGREAQSGNKPARDDFALTEDERRVMMTFVNEGVMTKDQYIADLKAIKGVS